MAIVAVDYGTKRIGVAVSESEVIASPHSVIENRDRETVLSELVSIAEKYHAGTFLIGIPVRQTAGAVEMSIRDFAEALRQKSCRDVVLWDEGYSTAEAASRRRELGKSRRSERAEIDMQAATVILQSYLDERRRREP